MNVGVVGFFLVIFVASAESLVVKNNGYENLLIAINDDVNEDPSLIDALKDTITKASAVLFNTTGNRLYFRDVTIIIPDTWSKTAFDKRIKGYKSSIANVRLEEPTEEYGGESFTLQDGECGQQGEYLHLNQDFLQKYPDNAKRDRRFVQEWAQYRFGVFKESPDPQNGYHKFYTTDGKTSLPSGCTSHSKGELIENPGCILDPYRKVPNDKCDFEYDTSGNFTVSFMFRHDLPGSDGFCGMSPDRPHNRIARNKHNDLCNGRSVWEVMSKHEDIKNSRPISPTTSTVPKFSVQKEGDPMVFVFVLDVSGSMSTADRIQHLYTSCLRTLDIAVIDDSHVAIIEFNNAAKLKLGLTKVDQNNREAIKKAVPNAASGGTSIGAGLRMALQILGSNAEGALIYLMTDGEENSSPLIDEVAPAIKSSGVILNGVSFGQQASSKIVQLSLSTSGTTFHVFDGQDAGQKLANTFYQSIVQFQTSYSARPVKLSSNSVPLQPNQATEKRTVLDETVGNNTRFSLFSSDPAKIDFQLISPENLTFSSASKEFRKGIDSLEYYFPQAASGEWKSKITYRGSGSPATATMEVSSAPVSRKEAPARIDGRITNREFDFNTDKLPLAKVTAKVFKKSSPVHNAYAEATITRPTAQPVKIRLLDNGQGADVQKGDGIYSAYFSEFNANGFYAIDILVKNTGNATILQRQNTYSGESDLVHVPIEKFERVTSGGAFRVNNYRDTIDVAYPPAKVTDFSVNVVTLREGVYLAEFQFTVPDDHFPANPGCSVDIRAAYSYDELISNFTSALKFDTYHLVRGSMTCEPTSEKQTIVVLLPKDFIVDDPVQDAVVFFALKASNKHNVSSAVSNIVYSAYQK